MTYKGLKSSPIFALLMLFAACLGSNASATTYDWTTVFSFDVFNTRSFSKPYQDLTITVTDNSDPMGWPSASTNAAQNRLFYYGSGIGNANPGPVLMRITKTDGSTFTPTGSLTLYYSTYSPGPVPPSTYQTSTATVRAYSGTTLTGTASQSISGPGSFTITFSSLTGFSNITALEFDNGKQDLSIGPLTLGSSAAAPTVTTATQSGVTSTSATLGGNVTADGGASVTERGIVWKTTSGPTTADNKVPNGSGTGAFSGTVNSLPANATIYVRAYAINSVNTSYGSEISFATPALPVAISSLNRNDVSPNRTGTVNWTLTFASAVSGVTASNFTLTGAAATGATVGTPTTGSGGLSWSVPVTTGSTDGELTLNLANSTGITPGVSTALPYAGQSYTMDKTAPTISIGAPSASSVNVGGSVSYTVTYADTNFGISVLANGHITLNTTGTASGTVGVSGSGLTRTVTISNVTGSGTIGISIAASTANDTAGNVAPAAGPSGTFAVTALAPTVTSINPTSGSTAGGTPVTITGTNFTGATGATVGGVALTGVTVNATTITGTTGAHAAGVVDVAITGAPGGASTGGTGIYTYVAPPSVDIPVTLGVGGLLTIDATGASGAASTSVTIVDLGGGVFVLEIKDLTRTIGAPAGGTQVDSNTARIPLGLVGNIVINGTSFGDTFTLDVSATSLPGLVTVNGNLPTTTPGDSLRVIGAYDDITYGPNGIGSGSLNMDGTQVAFTGLEPLDYSAATIVNLTVQVDDSSVFAGDVITTIAAVDAGVNTEITFADNIGTPNGLESIKIGELTGTLTIEGDNVDNDFFRLQGLGSAMVGHVSIDGRGGNADVIQVYNATFAVTGANKNLSLTADFIGLGQTQSADTTPDDPGILRAAGNITLEANGDDTVTTPPLWGASGVWGTTLPSFYNATTFATRGTILNMGHIEKRGGNHATLTLRANRHVMIPLAGASGNTGGRIVSTNNKLHTIINSDRDALNGGQVSITTFAQVLTNGGDLTIGGGATPATTAAKGVTGAISGVAIQGATVNSSGGNISIRGTGADLANGVGVLINSTALKNSVAISSGAGNINITGVGGNGTNAHGFRLAGDTSVPTPGSATIQTTTGTITVAGTGVVATGIGIISSSNTSTSSTGGAAVSLTGISPGTQAFQMNPVTPGTAVVNSTNGTVTIAADTMALNANTGTESITAGTGTVTLKPTTAGKNIALGSGVTDTGSLLAIDSSTELDNITAATVNIGDATSGTLTVSSVISPATFTTLGLASGSGTSFDATSGFTADVTTASNYEKITVIGTIDITAGAAFTANAAGGYVWNGTDTFTFLDNDGIDAITGTFTGPTLTNFLGSTLTATQSYTTGTGNDFGTGIAVANNANLANLQLKSGSTTHVLTPVFAAGTTSYTLDLPNQTISAQINATVADSAATPELSINGRPFTTLTSGSFTGAISLNTGGNTFAVRVTAPDMVTQKTYTVTITRAPLPPLVLGQTASAGGGTGGGTIDAPNGDATSSLGKWESIRQGAVMSNSGALAFRGHMEVGSGTPPVTVNDFQGIWKYDTVDTRLKARSGSAAPETGGALFDMLPLNPAISPSGFISFYGSLRMGTGIPEVTAADNQGLWSELGGGTLRLVLREGDNVPGTSVAKTFRSGFAVTSSSANTLAINARLSSGTALLHLDVSAPATVVTVVAEEGQAAPGGGTWVALDGNSSDPRLSPSGGLGFIGWELVGTAHIQGIYSRSGGTPPGTPGVVLDARVGSSAPGTGGATFRAFERPTVFDGGIAFRGFLNQDGDNAGGTRGQGIWYRDGGALAPVIRTGDGNAEVSSIPVGSTVTSVWSPFSNSQSTIAYRVGLSNGVTETRAIMTTSSTSTDIVAMVGDAAPGLPGETFTNFDHPVIGDRDHVAFTASTNAGSYGLWRSHFDSGAFRLVLKVGDSINTSQGVKTIAGISLPGATTDDRKFESVCLDDNGNILVHITFSDGSTSLLLGQ